MVTEFFLIRYIYKIPTNGKSLNWYLDLPDQAGSFRSFILDKLVHYVSHASIGKRQLAFDLHAFLFTLIPATCGKGLDSTTCTSHEDKLYCKVCYGKAFGPKGYGFAGGAAGLSANVPSGLFSSDKLVHYQDHRGSVSETNPSSSVTLSEKNNYQWRI